MTSAQDPEGVNAAIWAAKIVQSQNNLSYQSLLGAVNTTDFPDQSF